MTLNAVPYEQMFTNIDAQLQAGNPPDVFRVPYYTFGAYAGRDQLLDLSAPPARRLRRPVHPRRRGRPCRTRAKPFGVPHHTDTSTIVYNKDALASAGITSVPTTLEEAWTWDEFEQVAQTLRKELPSEQVPVRLQLAGQRRHPLAQLAVRGRRPLPGRGPDHPGDRLRRGPVRRRLHQELLHQRAACRRTAR